MQMEIHFKVIFRMIKGMEMDSTDTLMEVNMKEGLLKIKRRGKEYCACHRKNLVMKGIFYLGNIMAKASLFLQRS